MPTKFIPCQHGTEINGYPIALIATHGFLRLAVTCHRCRRRWPIGWRWQARTVGEAIQRWRAQYDGTGGAE